LFKSRTRAVIGPFERANGTCVSQLCYRFALRSPDDSGGSGGLWRWKSCSKSRAAAGGGAQIRFGRRAKSIGQSAKTIIVFGAHAYAPAPVRYNKLYNITHVYMLHIVK